MLVMEKLIPVHEAKAVLFETLGSPA